MIIVIILLKIMIKAFIPGACYRSNTQYCPTLLARYLYLYLIFILFDTISNVFIFLFYFYFTFILHDTIDRVILLVFVYFHKTCIFIFSIFLDKSIYYTYQYIFLDKLIHISIKIYILHFCHHLSSPQLPQLPQLWLQLDTSRS